jgi:uncharacterized protein YjbI with pentapeptide repeats
LICLVVDQMASSDEVQDIRSALRAAIRQLAGDDQNLDDARTYAAASEAIRKANLCGADLRGALVAGVDFYLVDLRGAKYDSDQEAHFRQCDAILENYAV